MKTLRMLVVEDSSADWELVKRTLVQGGFQPQWERVETEADFLEHLTPDLDLVLSDFSLPQFSGLRALELLRAKYPDIPFILISGTIGEDSAVEAIKQGASDYLLKDRLGRLASAVESALHQRVLRDERRKLEEQFRQSQKMEAIGQLSGGVAHDFNNLLTVIQMHASLMQLNNSLPPEIRESARQIGQASEQAANLTRQLLTFSRGQNLQLVDLSLNEVVTNIAKMLQRILGEDIHLDLRYSAVALTIHADAGMMDQILLNLVVNSRDAMPNGGQLIIETSAVNVDESMAAKSSDAFEGSFACLAVSDTGCGIPAEVMPRIFEPFFTTKEEGKGTGLGLATIYGIVRQHQGWIDVESREGAGTTFRIYLPRLKSKAKKRATQIIPGVTPLGTETILVVEDDATLRSLVTEVLTRLGYRVLEASSGQDALEIWNQSQTEINLLLTDLVMPSGVSGLELARKLLQGHPELKVIYTSGYSQEIAGKELNLQEGFNFIAKPYYPNKLAQTIRNRLDS